MTILLHRNFTQSMHAIFVRASVLCILLLLGISPRINANASEQTNILLIIADDMGVDALNGYNIGEVLPHTPNIDKLRENGLTFTNVWAAPACAPTRAAILTGQYGANSGINSIPGILKPEQKSVFKEINEQSNDSYAICVTGKWHNGIQSNIDHPYTHGATDFMGVIGSGVEDYYNWAKVENHESTTCTEYTTSYFTNYAINWINNQTKPWLMWLAHVSPHTPFHVPPGEMYTTENVKTNQQKFMAMIEALDYEIGRMLDSIPQEVLDNTVIIFLGDNGTPGNIIQGFTKSQGKSTVYQGGIHVPLIVSGKGVTRKNEREDAMINVSDLYATMVQIAEPNAFGSNKVNDSYSFKHLLSSTEGQKRSYNYMDQGASIDFPFEMYTIRNSQYKIIYDTQGKRELFDLLADPFETNNLLVADLSNELKSIKTDLEAQMKSINGLSFEDDTSNDSVPLPQNSYPIVDTDVHDYYNNSAIISAPQAGEAFYGQDAHYNGHQPSYTDNGDGTVTDNITGLMWEQDMGEKITYNEAFEKAANSTLGSYSDWRVPTIKELYSLLLFSGRCMGETAIDKFIDTDYFNQPIGNTAIGEREIDAQTWSATTYTGLIMRGDTGIFGVNFIDGRLKGYPKINPQNGEGRTMYFRMVRGNTSYGINNFVDNGDGTITDLATGLMWQQADDGSTRNWEDALRYCQDLSLSGYSDWRLPNAKELHSIVDYTRCPDATDSPAIDPLFSCSTRENPDGVSDYGYYWSSSPLMDGPNPYTDAVYISFGEAQGQMNFQTDSEPTIYDTHGAGASRNDPKEMGAQTYPQFHGPQGDILYVNNFVRAVRNVSLITTVNTPETIKEISLSSYPNPFNNTTTIQYTLSNNAEVEIAIYNVFGQKITSLFKGTKSEGSHSLQWDGTNHNGKKVKPGLYFCRMLNGSQQAVLKMNLIH